MSVNALENNNGSHPGRVNGGIAQIANVPPSRRLHSIDPQNRMFAQNVEDMLSSALRASDYELDQILQEVDEISQALKSDAPDAQTLQVAVHPAVWRAVRQALLDRELRQLALTDDLTCLYNRRGFFAAATHQMKLACRNQQPLLLFFCDVDNLRKINDSHGHREGDLCIVRAADALEKAFRGSDVLARLGGDEFAALACENSAQARDVILRRLEQSLKKSFSAANETRYELSLSVAVARFDPKRAVSLGELMAQAGKDMYEKKRTRPLSLRTGIRS
jgi:diguanylate cyclase (GGDEF)-like protein